MVRFRWKRLLVPAAFAGVLFVAPDDSLGQRGGFGGGGGAPPSPGGGFGGGAPPSPGGGFGGGGSRGGFNMGSMADGQFDRLVKSYGGSGETLDYSKIPNDVREQSNMMAQRFGSPPLPTSGTVSKADFRGELEKRMAARMGGSAPGATAPGTSPTPSSGDKVVVLGGTPGAAPGGITMTMTTPGGGSPPPGGGFGGGGFGGGSFGGRGGSDQMNPETRFKEMDKDQNGKITKEEAANGSRRLTGVFDQSDTNKDGTIDLAEYTVYFTAAVGGMSSGGPGGGPSGWGGGGSIQEKKLEEPDEPKPVVYRFGHLPQGLPAYFTDADADKDGQIGLYEWVKYWDTTETRLVEFKALDQNGDGLLTAEEYMRVKKVTPAQLAQASGGRGGPPSFGTPPSYGTPPGTPPSFGTPPGTPPSYGTPPVNPTAERAPPSPGATLEDLQKKDERIKDPRKEEKKEEKKDSRSSGDTRGSSSRFGTPPTGGSPFNPGGNTSTPPGGGRPGR